MRVSELLERFATVKLLAETGDLDGEIRWVHATDLADPTRYLKGGEFILTNGQWRRRRSDSAEFVRRYRRPVSWGWVMDYVKSVRKHRLT